MLRWKLSPTQWQTLSEDERDELLAYDVYLMRQLNDLTDKLIEQEAYTPEVLTRLRLVQLGL